MKNPHLTMNKKEFLQPWSLVDWRSQWEMHGLNFYDGYVHMEIPDAISEDWKQLKLGPGAGFGDLSHPTTRLVLRMMNDTVANHYVVDIGCGSGVLALCAIALGAKHVIALDIDEKALEHTKENAILNGMNDKLTCSLPDSFAWDFFNEDSVLLMNMILSEQTQAWKGLKQLHDRHALCVTSGILIEQKSEYIELTKEWGWNLFEERKEQEWMGFKFT